MNDIQDQINSLFQRLKSLDPKERISILSSLKDSLEFSEPELFPPLTGNKEGSKEDGIPCAADNHQAEGVKARTKLLPFQRKRFTLSSRELISRQEETPSRSHVGRTVLTLSCPVCGLKATTWQKFSNHLHTGHSSAVISVCRRCNGIFKTRALLLAHECFLWGRKNLPCSAVYSSIDQSSRFLKKFGFPDTGIYFERRCGLCPASDMTFSSYEQFERHKYEEHADSNSTPPPFDTRRPKGLVFQGPPGQRLSRTLQNRFACSSRPTGLQRPSKRALWLTHASAAARMTATTTATKQLFLTRCAERVVVHVHPIDRDREPTETHHHPLTLPSVDSIEETAEVPAHTEHVCQVCSTSFTTAALLQEHIESEHCPVVEENVEACQTPSESTEERPEEATAVPAPAVTTISLVGALEQEDTGSPDKAPEEAGKGAKAVPLNVVLCKLCRISFRNSEFLQRHERNSTQHAKKMKMLAKARAHIRKSQLNRQIASGGRADNATHVYCCTDCGLTYARKQSLDRHISVVHHQEATFVCEYCDFEATDRTTFSEHMARHFHLKDVACEFCNHRCISKRELKDHILFKHQDERSYACSICAKTFKTAGTLSRHRRTHTGISFTCELCSSKFNRQSNLTRHMKTMHPSGTLFRKRRGRRRATPATDLPSAGGPSPLPPIRPKSASSSTTTEVLIPTAVESEATGVTNTFGSLMDCNSLPASNASVPVEVAGFVSMAQDGGLRTDLSSQDLPQTSQPATVAATSKPVYFVACNPTAMSSFSSTVNAHFTSFSSMSFPSAEEHTSLEVDGQNKDVDVDAVSRSLTADQSGTCHTILDSPSPSHNEGVFGCLDPHQKTLEPRVPGSADSGSHFSGLPCVSDFFFDAHTTTTTPSVFRDGSNGAVHVCFSSHLPPISSRSGTSSRPIWRPLDDLHLQNSLSDAASLFSSSSAITAGAFTTTPSDTFRVAFGDPNTLHHEYSAPDGSPSYTTAGKCLGFPPPVCTPISPGGVGSVDATVSASQPSPSCWHKSGSSGGGGGGDDDLHCALFEDSAEQQQQQSVGGLASDFFVIPSSSLRIAKFSDMLPSLNSGGGGGGHGCSVVETMVEAASSSVDVARNNHTDFSVGYLIGGEGSAAVGGGCDDCYGAMTTALQVSTHSTLTVSSSAFGAFFSSGGLPSLPTSDCLSLIPISSNFEDLSSTTDVSCNGYLL